MLSYVKTQCLSCDIWFEILLNEMLCLQIICCCFCHQVAKQWYDYERTSFTFVKKLSEPNCKGITFIHQRDFDENGLMFWIGTNARFVKHSSEWVIFIDLSLFIM